MRLFLLAQFCDLFSFDAPIVCIDLLDDYVGRSWILGEHFDEQRSYTSDQSPLLLGADTFAGDLNIYVGHDL